MSIWKIVSGILSVIFSFFLVFRSLISGLLVSGDKTGTIVLALAAFMIVYGTAAIGSHDSCSNGWNILLIFIYGVASIGGYLFAGDYKTIAIYATWCLVCSVVLAIAIAADNICGAPVYIIISIIGISIAVAGIGENFFFRKDIQTSDYKEPTRIEEDIQKENNSKNVQEIENESLKRYDCDFRNAKWEDSKETVKKYDDTIIIEEESNDIIAGRDSVSGYDVIVGYEFDDNGKLFRGSYIFLYQERDTWKFITAYEDLKGEDDQYLWAPKAKRDCTIDITRTYRFG